MERNGETGGESLLKAHLLDVCGQGFLRFAGDGHHFGFEGKEQLGHLAADVAPSYDGDALAGEFRHGTVPAAEVGADGPVRSVGAGTFAGGDADLAAVMSHLVADLKQKCHGMLCNGQGAVGRDIAYRHTMSAGRCHINVVVACGGLQNQTQAWKFCKLLFAEPDLVREDDIGILCADYCLFRGAARIGGEGAELFKGLP